MFLFGVAANLRVFARAVCAQLASAMSDWGSNPSPEDGANHYNHHDHVMITISLFIIFLRGYALSFTE